MISDEIRTPTEEPVMTSREELLDRAGIIPEVRGSSFSREERVDGRYSVFLTLVAPVSLVEVMDRLTAGLTEVGAWVTDFSIVRDES